MIQVFKEQIDFFVISFEDKPQRVSYKRYYLPTVEINCNAMIDGQNYNVMTDESVRNNLGTYDSIRKIATYLGSDYTTSCLLDYNYL